MLGVRPYRVMSNQLGVLSAILGSLAVHAFCLDEPPMGWNSWDSYGTSVREAEVKTNADFMAKRLRQHGWRYVVVDIQWSEPKAKAHGYRPDADLVMDAYGRLT